MNNASSAMRPLTSMLATKSMLKISIVIIAFFNIFGCDSRVAENNEMDKRFIEIGKDKIIVIATKIDEINFDIKIESMDEKYEYLIGRPELVGNMFIDNININRIDNLPLSAYSIHSEIVTPNRPILATIQLTLGPTAPSGTTKFKIGFSPNKKLISGEGMDSYAGGDYVYWSNELELVK